MATPHASVSTPIVGGHEVRPTLTRAPRRERSGWVLYDFANTIFSMNIATLYFNLWLVTELLSSNTAVAVGNGISSVTIV
jgi:MFS-type transporter involved in bile tolerance (Atg22 family)